MPWKHFYFHFSLHFFFSLGHQIFANFNIPRAMIHFSWAMIKLGNLWLVWLILSTLMTTVWRCSLSKRTHRIEIILETEIFFGWTWVEGATAARGNKARLCGSKSCWDKKNVRCRRGELCAFFSVFISSYAVAQLYFFFPKMAVNEKINSNIIAQLIKSGKK